MILAFAAAIAAAQPAAAAPAAELPAPAPCIDARTLEAFQCRAVNAAAVGRYAEAAEAFEQVAAAALARQDPAAVSSRALAAAGNMWIAAAQPGKAALTLDRALAGGGLEAEQRGQALLDRARAAEEQNDLKTARAKVQEAEATISADPFLWYFSSALAIREGNTAAASQAIARALTLAPNDPTILFEAGHVAHFTGDLAKARTYWLRAYNADSDGKAGMAARKALDLLPPVPADGNAGPPEKPGPVQSEASPTK